MTREGSCEYDTLLEAVIGDFSSCLETLTARLCYKVTLPLLHPDFVEQELTLASHFLCTAFSPIQLTV